MSQKRAVTATNNLDSSATLDNVFSGGDLLITPVARGVSSSTYSSTTTLNDVNSSAIYHDTYSCSSSAGDGYNTSDDDDDDDESNTLRDTDSLACDEEEHDYDDLIQTGCTNMNANNNRSKLAGSGGGGNNGVGAGTAQQFTIQRRRKVELKRVQSGGDPPENTNKGE